MHSTLRAYVTATSLLMDADESQVDERGRSKAVSTVWAEMPNMSADLITTAEQLMDDPTLSHGEPCGNEERWLRAIVDEVGTPGKSELSTDESWASIARFTAWLAFCMRQAATYAEDSDFGKSGFERIRDLLQEAEDYEKANFSAAVTEASLHMASTESETSRAIVDAYDDLIRGLS